MGSTASTAFMFGGQGSQKTGMLKELSEQFPQIFKTFEEASQALDMDLWAISQSADGRLEQTALTQPVLLTASVALWRLWQDLGGIKPACMLGHSLGEYSALTAAGVLTLSEAVALVHLRGQLMQDAVPAGLGMMAAILGLSDAEVQHICDDINAAQPALNGSCIVQAANFNAVGQLVIAGHREAVQAAISAAKVQGAKAIMVPVSVPSHCSLMQPVVIPLQVALDNITFNAPTVPIVQNINGEMTRSPELLKAGLLAQITAPVLWRQSLQTLAEAGITQLIECGPGNVLCNLAKRASQPLPAYPTDNRLRLESALMAAGLAEGKLS